jgi:hypothetical protein
MADRVRSKQPPEWVIRHVANPLMRLLLPTRVGRWVPGMVLLRFQGRRTGASYSVPIGIYDYQDAQVVFSEAPWVANFLGGAPVEVVRRGHTTTAYGEVVSDPGYVGPAIRAALDAGTSTTMLGLAIDRGYQPTDNELSAVRKAVVIRPHP